MHLKEKYDIIVAGAGIAGISAAVKAASMGVSVLLIEHYPFLGGMSAAGMVSPFMKSETDGINLVKGVYKEIELGLKNMGGMIDNGFYSWAFRSVANALLWKHNVDIAFNTDLVAVEVNSGEVKSIKLSTNDGLLEVKAKQFIDTTGDAQLVSQGNFSWLKGDEQTGKLQALTLFFRMGGINVQKTADYVKQNPNDFLDWMDIEFDFKHIISIAGYKSFIKKAQDEGRLSKEIEYIFFTTLPESGEGSFNCTNILGIDPSDSEALTKAELIGHQQVAQLVDLMNNEVPGFESAYLIDTGIQVGVRETRRAVAEYMMSGDDILKGADFTDTIARGCYGIDIHGQENEKSRMEELQEGAWYGIPYRSLLVKNSENLLVAGRCIGSTREGHSALRIMPTASATGEACGAAAAIAVKKETALRSIDYQELKQELIYNIEEM